jgi:sterol desaturase/sphingolipid hydroxylase (fatty acid hydroxylase superfamily)
MHPIEHFLYFSAILIHFIIPSHPLHVFFHFIILSVGAIWGHTGFDALLIGKKTKVPLGHFDHQLHHRYFECNYGTFESPCDKWFGSFHDGTSEATEIMRNKRRKIHNI